MRYLVEQLVTALAVALLGVALTSPEHTVALGLVGIALAAVLSVRYAAVLLRTAEIRIGHRARRHREVLVSDPAPRHPNTAGRTRSRAPARPFPAA